MSISVVYTYTCSVPNCGTIISVPRAAQVNDVVPPAAPPSGWHAQWDFLICPKHKVSMTIDGIPDVVLT